MDKQIRVLVVDDEPVICHLVVDILVQEDYMVDVTFSGIDALRMIRKDYYHLLITDLGMPGIDGLQLIREAKKENPDIRTLILTGGAAADMVTWSLIYGIDNHMEKPFNIIELREMVKQALCGHKMVQEKLNLKYSK